MQDRKRIYCVRELPEGASEPSDALVADMTKALNEYVISEGIKGSLSHERHGTQYKPAHDVLQFYIVRDYELVA